MLLGQFDLPVGGPSPLSLASSIASTVGKFASGDTRGGILNLVLGSQIGGIVESLFPVKPSNDSAYIWFTAGPYPAPGGMTAAKNCTVNVCGDEANTQSKAFGAAVSNALAQSLAAIAAQGIQINSPPFIVVVGAVRGAGILRADHSGQWYKENIAPIGDTQATVLAVLNWLSQFVIGASGQPAYGQSSGASYQTPASNVPISPGSGETAPPVTEAGFPTQYAPYMIGAGVLLFGLMLARR